MSVIANANTIRALLGQIPVEAEIDAESLAGDREAVLFAIREMLLLGLITGRFEYGEVHDPIGPLLTSASEIHLTKRGVSLR